MTLSPNPPVALRPGQRYDKDYTYDFYDEKYYHSVLANEKFLSHKLRVRLIDQLLKPQTGDRIIDLGCGAGMVAKHMATRGAIVHGVDLADSAVAIARKANERYPMNTFEQGDASSLPHLPDASFNKGCSIDVTEHCGYDVMLDIFREAFRLIQPGGLYYVYTPNPFHWIERARKLHLLKQVPAHTGLRPARVVIEALEKTGFQVVAHAKPPSMIPVLNIFEKLWSLQPIFRQLGIYRIALLARKPG
jgi:2-polyprenyl-3-methyl-5-hydroxy-6-metoxy-1,4-benzoquinol methylase